MRPETAWRVLLVRPTWTVGFGPMLDHAPPTVAAAALVETVPMPADALMPLRRSFAARSTVIGWSPATSRDSK